MTNPHEDGWSRLTEALKLVAAEPSVQLSSLPDGVLKADEIVLTFDECLASVSDLVEAKRLPLDVKKKIQEIDKLFERMTQEGGDHWTEDAVRSNREWKEARELAGEILERMKVPMDRPRLDWVTYVLESKDPSPPRNIRNFLYKIIQSLKSAFWKG